MTHRNSLSAGSIVGITLSIVGILGVLAALFLFIRRRQRLNGYVKELETPSYVTDKHRGVVTMSSLGPGPATGDLQTTGNLIPAPFPMSSIAPSESDPQSRSGSPGSSLVRPAPTRRSPSPAGAPKHQVRFSDQPEEREFQVSVRGLLYPAHCSSSRCEC
ncbi:hypothetical protein FPV67DRAFT_996091 [Lyophyllum atratum]|nr:hypothetical protein FPV67DRAFT_996091 [Lyophyllum atratum]